MPRKTKKPWNHGLKIPGLNAPAHVPPPPAEPYRGPLGMTTGQMVAPCSRCERLARGEDAEGVEHAPGCAYRDTGRDPEGQS